MTNTKMETFKRLRKETAVVAAVQLVKSVLVTEEKRKAKAINASVASLVILGVIQGAIEITKITEARTQSLKELEAEIEKLEKELA